MKAPNCSACYKRLDEGSGTVYFCDHELPPEQIAGQHEGWGFFCSEHIAAAEVLSHLTEPEALTELEKQFGVFPKPWEQPGYGKPPDSLWWHIKDFWKTFIGIT